MSREVSNKNWVLVATGIGRVYLTKQEADLAKKVLAADGSSSASVFEIGDCSIRVNSIHAIVPATQLTQTDRIRQGDFQCKYAQWHQKGITCNCKELKFLGRLD